MSQFKDFALNDDLLKTLEEIGYQTPTPIQIDAIPILLNGKDLLASAQTGTGKTAAYVLPLLNFLSKGRTKPRMPRSVILTPTRELATQVVSEIAKLGKTQKIRVVQIIGGEGFDIQEKALSKTVDIIVATPGRLLDLIQKSKIILNDGKFLIIDEADKMLDMGFWEDVEKIIFYLPKTRQTALFSATFPKPIKDFAQKILTSPEEVMISPPATLAKTIEQFFVHTDDKDHAPTLKALLKKEGINSGIVFCNTKKSIKVLETEFSKWKLSHGVLHGDLAQSVRTATWEQFKNGEIKFLIASDVAARGLDYEGLDVVINYDMPSSVDDYVHRIGRTGRAGKNGKSYTLILKKDNKAFDLLAKKSDVPLTILDLKEKKPVEKLVEKVEVKTEIKERKPTKIKASRPVEKPIVSEAFGEDTPAFMKAVWKFSS